MGFQLKHYKVTVLILEKGYYQILKFSGKHLYQSLFLMKLHATGLNFN